MATTDAGVEKKLTTVDHNGREVEVINVAYFKGVAFEEDIEAAVAKAVSIFGQQGRMLYESGNVLFNQCITSRKLGKIWYGDIKILEAVKNMKALEVALNDSLTLVDC